MPPAHARVRRPRGRKGGRAFGSDFTIALNLAAFCKFLKNSLGKTATLSAGGKGLAGRRVGWLLGWLAGLVWLPVWPASWLAAGLRGSTGSNIDAPKWGTEKGMEPKNGSNFGTPKKTSSDAQKHSPPRCPK